MVDLKRYLNVSFEFYNENEVLIDKIDGPGDIGTWLSGPESPLYIAILPAPYKLVADRVDNHLYSKVVCTPLDVNFNPIGEKKNDFILYDATSFDDAKKLALAFSCDYFYWSEWDGNRLLIIALTSSNISVYKDPSTIIFYDED